MKRLLTLLLVLTFCACGDDDDPSGPEGPPDLSFSGTVEALATAQHDFTTPAGGEVSIVLRWPSTDVDLDLYLSDGECTGYPPRDCTPLLVVAQGTFGNVEAVKWDATAGEEFIVWVDSFAEGPSPYTIEIWIE